MEPHSNLSLASVACSVHCKPVSSIHTWTMFQLYHFLLPIFQSFFSMEQQHSYIISMSACTYVEKDRCSIQDLSIILQ